MKRTKYYRPQNRDYMSKRNEWLFPTAMVIFAVAMLAGVSAKACDEIYLKVGAGYKFSEADKFTINGKDYDKDYSPVSARIEIGKQVNKWSYGISHHSQYFTGWPVSNEREYSKTEIFIDYKISW